MCVCCLASLACATRAGDSIKVVHLLVLLWVNKHAHMSRISLLFNLSAVGVLLSVGHHALVNHGSRRDDVLTGAGGRSLFEYSLIMHLSPAMHRADKH